jgi:hypothetical protein
MDGVVVKPIQIAQLFAAIQEAVDGQTGAMDTVETVAKHYGRFLPQDKAALAAQVLNRTWGSEPDQPC